MRRKLRRCKNGHPLWKYKAMLLTDAVVVCDKCGRKHIYSNIPCVYVGDEKNPAKEVFHAFVFSNIMFCSTCRNIMTMIKIACTKDDIGVKNWQEALGEFTEKKNENLCGTPDNGSDI